MANRTDHYKDRMGMIGYYLLSSRSIFVIGLKEEVESNKTTSRHWPILNRLCHMIGRNQLTISQISNRPRQFQHPMKRSR